MDLENSLNFRVITTDGHELSLSQLPIESLSRLRNWIDEQREVIEDQVLYEKMHGCSKEQSELHPKMLRAASINMEIIERIDVVINHKRKNKLT